MTMLTTAQVLLDSDCLSTALRAHSACWENSLSDFDMSSGLRNSFQISNQNIQPRLLIIKIEWNHSDTIRYNSCFMRI